MHVCTELSWMHSVIGAMPPDMCASCRCLSQHDFISTNLHAKAREGLTIRVSSRVSQAVVGATSQHYDQLFLLIYKQFIFLDAS